MVPVGEVNNGGGFQPCPEQIHHWRKVEAEVKVEQIEDQMRFSLVLP
jgi:hypothetical protein